MSGIFNPSCCQSEMILSSSSSQFGHNHPRRSSPSSTSSGSNLKPNYRNVRVKEKSEISSCLKYFIFGSNVLFWLFGLCVTAVGLWAWTEKDYFSNLTCITNVALDPAFILIVGGSVAFIIGLTGCIGALRENTSLLASYVIFLVILLLFEMTVGILGFIFKDWIKSQATSGFRAFIVYYRDDPDRQNLVDWIQEQWLECCGIEGPKDWDMNIYFNCSSVAVGSREACGVPFSCCKPIPNEMIKNKQCGYDVRKPDYASDKSAVIYEKGCLRAGEEWIEANFFPVAGFSISVAILQNGKYEIYDRGCLSTSEAWARRNLFFIVVAVLCYLFLQILGICFAQNLRADVFAQRAKWH